MEIVKGIAFPVVSKSGSRSSTVTAKVIWSRAFESVGATDGSARVQQESDWRHRYPQHVLSLFLLGLQSRENSLNIAREGMNAVYESFRFVRDGNELTLSEAVKQGDEKAFSTFELKGSGSKSQHPVIKMPLRGRQLVGDEIVQQVRAWAQYGCVEPDVADAVGEVVSHPDYLNMDGIAHVLIGSGSELGPMQSLLSIGATVVPIATRNPAKWSRLFSSLSQSSATLLLPTLSALQTSASHDDVAAKCGCNLMEETPELIAWLKQLLFSGKFHTIVISNNVYVDGEAHVRASVAMDLIVTQLVQHSKQHFGVNVCVAYLGSPAMPNCITQAAHEAKVANAANAPMWQRWLGFTSSIIPPIMPSASAPDGVPQYANDGMLVVQGPNYALAKTIQMWRAVLLREDERVRVSFNMAPPCRSLSVTHNPTVATTLEGLPHFVPNVTFDPETGSALLFMLLLHDIRSASSVSNPSVPVSHPHQLFASTSAHGGNWRCPWLAQSSVSTAYLLGRVWPSKGI